MPFPSRRLVARGVLMLAVLAIVLAAGFWAKSTLLARSEEFPMPMGAGSLYDIKVAALDGRPADLAAYKGRVTLVVNVASRCGYTPQYAGLEQLHRELAPKGFAVLGFPSNDFGGQEPGAPEEIQQFCRLTYGVTFPMFSKVFTRAGADQSPVYAFLGESGSLPQWNFSKYVVDKNGKVVAFFPSRVAPDAPELRAAIEKALAQ
jgi:glutathione peroxidase